MLPKEYGIDCSELEITCRYSNSRMPGDLHAAHTHAAGTSQDCTPPTNWPTPHIQDFMQSLNPSYALQLCSFPLLTAAIFENNYLEKT